jgi:hypothetical protein
MGGVPDGSRAGGILNGALKEGSGVRRGSGTLSPAGERQQRM